MNYALLKLVLDDVGENVAHFETCGSYLLRNEAGGCHARSGVHFKHIDAVGSVLVLGDDVIDANDAVAVQYVVDAAGFLLQSGC